MDGVAPFERWELAGVIKTNKCPRRMISDDSSAWIALYGHYKAGHLAYSGGVLEQPAIYLEAMRLIDATVQQNG